MVVGDPLLLILVALAGIAAIEVIGVVWRAFLELLSGHLIIVVFSAAFRMILVTLIGLKSVTGLLQLHEALELLHTIPQ